MKKSVITVLMTVLMAVSAFAQVSYDGIMIRPNGPIYKDDPAVAGNVKWYKSIEAGTVLKGVKQADFVEKKVTGDKKPYKMYACTYNNEQVYVLKSSIAVDNENGRQLMITKSDIPLFTLPSPETINGNVLPIGSIVAAVTGYGVSKQISGTTFQKISYYDPSGWVVREAFVPSYVLSGNTDSMRAMKMYKNAMANKDPSARVELLSNALELGMDSELRSYIRAAFEEAQEANRPFSDRYASNGSESMSGTYIVSSKAGEINVREKPGKEESNAILGVMTNGTEVKVSAATVDFDTINGVSAQWYKISGTDKNGSNVEGWVFSNNLQNKKEEVEEVPVAE